MASKGKHKKKPRQQQSRGVGHELNEAVKAEIINIAVHHLPHDPEALKDPVAASAAIQQMYWTYVDNHQSQQGLPYLEEEAFVKLVYKHISELCQNPAKGWRHYQENMFKPSSSVACGVCFVDPTRTKVLMLKGCHAPVFGFPKGKMEEGEDMFTCAKREAFEETKFRCEMYVRQEDVIKDRNYYAFVGFDVPTSTKFEPKYEGEIEEFQWVSIAKPEVPLNNFTRRLLPKLDAFLKKVGKQERPVQYSLLMRDDTPFRTPAIWCEPFNVAKYKSQLASIWK